MTTYLSITGAAVVLLIIAAAIIAVWIARKQAKEARADTEGLKLTVNGLRGDLAASQKTAASLEGRYNELLHRMTQQDAYVQDLEKVVANSMQSVLLTGVGGPAAAVEHQEKSEWLNGRRWSTVN